ncbi:MAG: cation transporter [Acidobacteriota bacterium]|nr:MAG: cation transporter [Acidobacteriota bacterium]
MHHHADGADEHAAERTPRRRLALGLGLVLGFAVVEAAGGWWTGSLALLADATHMVADGAALALALVASILAERPHTPRATYGFHRAEILAALANAVLLGVIVMRIAWEALERIARPSAVAGVPMIVVAVMGLLVNLLVLWVLRAGHSHRETGPDAVAGDLNLRAAAAHVLGDLAGSGAAILAAGLIIWKGWTIADPLASLAVSLLIGWSAWRILKESTAVLLEVAPPSADPALIERELSALAHVIDVHDLHVWSITPQRVALSVHLRLDDPSIATETLRAAKLVLGREFGIYHTTIQIEPPGGLRSGHRLPAHPGLETRREGSSR